MNHFQINDLGHATQVGFGVRTLLISTAGVQGPIGRKLAGLGCQIDGATELFAGLDAVFDDPSYYGLVVIDCDVAGGLQAGLRAHAMLEVTQRCLPVILVSSDCTEQTFPESRYAPTTLRAPLSAISLRVGFEHAMRERLLAHHA